jgi:hypothetical protein
MQRKLEAAKNAADLKKWIKRHPHSIEAREAAEEARIAAHRKFEAKMEAEKRREARITRKLASDMRLTASTLSKHFELDSIHPAGLRVLTPDAQLVTTRSKKGVKWKVLVTFGGISKSLWSAQVVSLLTPKQQQQQK